MSDLRAQFIALKEELASHLTQAMEGYSAWEEFHFDNQLLTDLSAFSTRGKMLRGVGFLMLSQALGFTNRPAALNIAAALELFQSALLIHDDVMDRDEKRRGQASIFKLYEHKAAQLELRDEAQFGIGAAICLGDMAFFIGYDLLSKLELAPEIVAALLQLTNQELVQLGMSQLQDSYLAARPEVGTEEDILNMYRGKTARYTWRWPLLLAAVATEQPATVKKQLTAVADQAGLVFQLRDDELGMFGNETQVGKAVGSDVREGKKTLYWLYLHQAAQAEPALKKLLTLFGTSTISEADLLAIRHALEEHGIQSRVEEKIQQLYLQSQQEIKNLELPDAQPILLLLLELTTQRKK